MLSLSSARGRRRATKSGTWEVVNADLSAHPAGQLAAQALAHIRAGASAAQAPVESRPQKSSFNARPRIDFQFKTFAARFGNPIQFL
jgi:hypothetical protein